MKLKVFIIVLCFIGAFLLFLYILGGYFETDAYPDSREKANIQKIKEIMDKESDDAKNQK